MRNIKLYPANTLFQSLEDGTGLIWANLIIVAKRDKLGTALLDQTQQAIRTLSPDLPRFIQNDNGLGPKLYSALFNSVFQGCQSSDGAFHLLNFTGFAEIVSPHTRWSDAMHIPIAGFMRRSESSSKACFTRP